MNRVSELQAEELRPKIKWLMILRATVVTLLLGSLAVLHVYQARPSIPAVYVLIVATYLLTIAYSIAFYHIRNLVFFAYVQIIGDVLLETGVVYATGGLDSAFSFTYIISVIAAGIILFRRGSLLVASLSGIFYGALADLQYYGVLLASPSRAYTVSELFYNIFLNFVAFYTVAFLASSLSERLRLTSEALAEKSLDLKELQALNDNIVRSMADGMVTVGLDGIITAFNKAAEEITGQPADAVRGRHFSTVFNWLGIDTFFEEGEFIRRHSYHFELVFPRADKELTLGMTISPLRNESGEMTGLLGIFQDLTPIKEMEEEMNRKDRLAAIGELSAGMAHEIRNPLASLSGSLQVLKSDLDLSDENKNLMDIALNEMDRLNRIVTEFLTYARPKPPSKEGCDLVLIARDTASLVAKGKEFRDEVRLLTELPEAVVQVKADPGQLRQVFLNLYINALQSITGPGTVRVRVGYQDGGTALIEVDDDGEGIKKDDMDKIFYPFFSTKEGGSGLGLAIVYRIVEEHGGSIRVHSASGKGTRFSITLPAEGGVIR